MKNIPDLVHRSIDAMFAIDGNQRVIFWNQACESLTGVPAGQAIGSPCHETLQGHDPSGRCFCKANCPLGQLAKGGPPPPTFSMRIPAKNNGRIQLNVGTMLMPSPVNQEWMVVHVLRRGHCNSSAALAKDDNLDRNIPGKEQPKSERKHLAHGLGLLTDREREILRLLTKGLATDTMSEHLHISTTTVRNHIQRLMAKLNVHSRIEAVTCAHQHHLI